jgi:D-glycero-D-manno-heptose 1,7-bisphosphate phosphatase
MYSVADVERLHDFMHRSLSVAGQARKPDVHLLHDFIRREVADWRTCIDAVAYCPHAPDAACDCRKPRTGMARQIERQLAAPLDYAASWTIGDKLNDEEFGRALGTPIRH